MSSAAAVKPKLTYRAKSKLEVFYTGGAVCLTRDGKYAICACGDAVKVVEVETGEVKRTFDGDSEPITALAVAPDSTRLYASSRSLTNRSWNLQTGECVRSWKAHKAPVADLALDASGGLLATASADRSLRVWDTDGGFCTHVFNGHEDVVLKALFHPTDLLLFSAGNDSNVFLWDLATRQMAGTLKGHYSAVTSLALSPDARQLVTGGRDKVVIVWDIAARAQMRSIPVFESVEAVLAMRSPLAAAKTAKNTKKPSAQDGSAFAIVTAGESGRFRMWGSATCAELLPAQDRSGASSRDAEPSTAAPEGGIVELCCTANCAEVLAATGDACLRLYEHQAAAGLREKKLLVGNLDDVTDVRLLGSRKGAGGPPSHVAVATNGADIRIFCLSTLACQASLCGHSDTVLCLDRACTGAAEGDGGAGELLASGSKDNSVRLWSLQQRRCLAVGEGHMASVSAVAFSRKTAGFVVSSGEDKLLKVWDTAAALKASRSATEAEAPVPLLATAGAAAHDKAVNVLAVAPNDQLVCSGSQDRTAKVWQLPSLTLSVTLSGHKRGVLDVAFSPIDRCIATASGDQTLRLWSLADGTCLKTFEGHTASVLRVRFLTAATQLLSSGADGLVRLWTVRSGECVGAFDEHDGKVWAMDVGDKQERLAVTGGQDGCVVVWEDSTVLDEQVAAAEEEQRMALQQSLDNALADSDWGAAMRLALGLRQPRQLLQVVVQALAQGQAKGAAILDALAAGMQPEEVQRALEYCRDWNTNSRSCQPAQALLHALLRRQPPAALLKVPGILSLLDTLSAYTQRHYARLQRLLRSTYLLDYTLSAMQVLVDTNGEADDNSSQRLTEQMVLDKDDVDADAIGRGLKLGLHEAAALYEGDEGYPMGIRNGHVGLGASGERGGDDEDELDPDNGDAMPATASSSEESDDGSEMEEDEPQSGVGSD